MEVSLDISINTYYKSIQHNELDSSKIVQYFQFYLFPKEGVERFFLEVSFIFDLSFCCFS